MKKLLCLVLILVLFSGAASLFAQVPSEEELVNTLVGLIEDDFSLLLSGMGTDFDPILMQNAMIGQSVGMAELGSEILNNFYFSVLPTVSVSATSGLFTFRDTQAYEDSLILKGMLEEFIFNESTGMLGALMADNEIADILLDKAFPIPAFKLNAGGKLPANLEILVHGMWLPSFLTDMAVGLIPTDSLGGDGSVDVTGLLPEFNYLNIGVELRYVLLRDSKQTPGMSIGLAGAYNRLSLDMPLGEMLSGALGSQAENLSENPFAVAGMSLASDTIVFGINTNISKKLAIFYPFIKLGALYGITDFSGDIVITEDASITGGAGHNDLDLLLSTGADVMLGPFGSNLTVDYNLGTGVWGVNLGSRLQF